MALLPVGHLGSPPRTSGAALLHSSSPLQFSCLWSCGRVLHGGGYFLCGFVCEFGAHSGFGASPLLPFSSRYIHGDLTFFVMYFDFASISLLSRACYHPCMVACLDVVVLHRISAPPPPRWESQPVRTPDPEASYSAVFFHITMLATASLPWF